MLDGRIQGAVRKNSINEIHLMSVLIVMSQSVNPPESLSHGRDVDESVC